MTDSVEETEDTVARAVDDAFEALHSREMMPPHRAGLEAAKMAMVNALANEARRRASRRKPRDRPGPDQPDRSS